MKNNITEKTIVITGGTKGVGKALTDLFREKGNRVIVLARTIEPSKDGYVCDVTDPKQVAEVFASICSETKVDILINNVGAGLGGAVEMLSYDYIDWEIKINLMSAIYCTKALLENTLPTHPLRIINISSIGAFGVQPFRTLYSVSKSAINMFTIGMRQELHGSNVSVCSVTLGDTQTDFGKHHPNDFRTNERYGNRISGSDETSAERSQEGKQDKRMPVRKAAEGIFAVVARKKYRYPTYCIGAKYKCLHLVSKLFTTEQVSEIVRRLFEK